MSESNQNHIALEEVPITPEQYDNISNIQKQALEMIASQAKTADILDHLCRLAESLLPNSIATIMHKNEKTGLISILSAPSVPQAGIDALANLKPGPHGGSCGNAVFTNQPQFVSNTFKDDRWIGLRQLAIDFNLCSCWSFPVCNISNEAIGTFALSSFEHRSPAPYHKKILETGAAIVKIVLKNQHNNERLKLFSTAMQNASEGIVITDKNNNILEVNPAFCRIHGYSANEVINKNPGILSSGEHDSSFYQEFWEKINEQSQWHGEIVNIRSDGTKITQWMSVGVIKDDEQQVQNHMSIYTDLTDIKESQKKIETMAFLDSLTGLFNKTYLEKIVKEPSNKHSLILLNINNFSYINTAYGFDIGDQLLLIVAQRLKENFKSHSCYRLNSDEFAFLINAKEDIEVFIHNIQNYFYNTALQIDKIGLNISFNYGAAYTDNHLLRNAALALKQSKENGKNRFHIFNKSKDSVDHSHREEFILSSNLLRNAIEEDRVVPFFQGIYDNHEHTINRFEVLVRLENNGQVISPYQFLEPARLSGLLPEISKIVIDKSFQAMQQHDYSFSINITEDDLSMDYLVQYLAEKSKQYQIDPNRVILEILEGISSSGKKNHIKQLKSLKQLGFSLAIDDFGIEYSNFERILELDIDFIKIDSKYIKDIDQNPKSYEITRAIAYFARNTNIPCVAEFVHNEAVQEIVVSLGIDYSQGFHFSEPSNIISNKIGS